MARLGHVHHEVRDAERGVGVSPVDHGISKALCFDDPDGNGLELYYDTRETNARSPGNAYGGRPTRY